MAQHATTVTDYCAALTRSRLIPEADVRDLHQRWKAEGKGGDADVDLFRKFLVAIDKAVPAELDVHLICDNLATHKTPAIRDWLARHPRFHLHFTPTGSSWINQVERWFGLLTDQLIRRGVHKSVVALENDVRQWIKTWNDDPKPFLWTKTQVHQRHVKGRRISQYDSGY